MENWKQRQPIPESSRDEWPLRASPHIKGMRVTRPSATRRPAPTRILFKCQRIGRREISKYSTNGC